MDIPEATTVGLGIREDEGRGACSEDLVMEDIRVSTGHPNYQKVRTNDGSITVSSCP